MMVNLTFFLGEIDNYKSLKILNMKTVNEALFKCKVVDEFDVAKLDTHLLCRLSGIHLRTLNCMLSNCAARFLKQLA